MTTIGYFLSCEEFGPRDLVEQAKRAEQAGFQALWISDHFHPWVSEQGQSPFVWSVIGAVLEATNLRVTTSVTCPTVRIHPAIVAQAAATCAAFGPGRFDLGLGSGEALNEHILGHRWPDTNTRLAMLEEAIEVIRALWQGGIVRHHGRFYEVVDARLYTLPEQLPRILISGFGPKATELAGRIGDGFCSAMPDGDLVSLFRSSGGGSKPAQVGTKVCWGPDRDECVATAHRLWANEALPGELAQELPMPAHFEQANQLVTKDMVAQSTVCGDDVDAHVGNIKTHVEAGFDEVYVQQIGSRQEYEGFYDFYAREVLPAVS